MSKKTVFNNDWLSDPHFSSWIKKYPSDSHKATCKVCDGRVFELGGKKHKLASAARDKTLSDHTPITSHWAHATTTTQPASLSPSPFPVPEKSASAENKIDSFLAKDASLQTEILWTITTVMEHYSCNSCENNNQLFAQMFPDSQIAQRYSCGRTKCGYFIKFGLAPYFHRQIIFALSQPGCLYSISFDESFSKVLQEEQMDLMVRFGDKERNRVVSRYFQSEFLGHTRASDLLHNFRKGLGSLDQANMVQVSMDGPTTNWKFYDGLVQQRNSEDIPMLLNMGSCSLHVVHGAFKRGAQMTGWNIDGLLRSLHYLLHDAPARAEDFVQLTGSSQLPLRLCSTRWLEDAPVAERALAIWPNVIKYVQETLKGPKSKVPKILSFTTAQQCTNDPLFPAKLQCFITLARLLNPYLEKYQTEKPMAVFMAEDLENILQTVMYKFVKKDIVLSASGTMLARIDMDKKDNMLSAKKVDVGFATRAIIEKLEKKQKVSQLQLLEFHTECQTFLKAMVEKIFERCPLKYSVVGCLSALDPRIMVRDPVTAGDKFQRLLSKLLSLRRFSADDCDEAKQQFECLLKEVENYHTSECKSFDPISQRLDTFYCELLDDKVTFIVLWKVIKMVLILSHGQADVERGFSENKQVVSYNMDRETLCAYRTVYDGVKQMDCGVHEVVISKEMLASCKSSHQRYRTHVYDVKQNKSSAERGVPPAEAGL